VETPQMNPVIKRCGECGELFYTTMPRFPAIFSPPEAPALISKATCWMSWVAAAGSSIAAAEALVRNAGASLTTL